MTSFAAPPPNPFGAESPRALRLATGFAALVTLTFGLIVLGAMVRAHGAGLACPDWPLCFGEFVPEFDLKVGFEWAHRAVAGGVSLLFAGLAALTLRRPSTRRATVSLLATSAALLVIQIVLGALTVWNLLAAWTVTAHLLTGNAFAVALLWTALALRGPPRPASPVSTAARGWVAAAATLLVLQIALGGLVSSRYAGLACSEWPSCNGGVWFPTWGGVVGLHLLHRMNGYLLLAVLAGAAWVARRSPGLGTLSLAAVGLALLQVAVGVANVRLGIPIEVTGLHSALATALVLTTSVAVRTAWLRPRC